MRSPGAALAAATLAVVAGCGSARTAATTQHRAAAPHCRLSRAQHRAIRKARREITLMHRLEQPLKTWHKTGPLPLELSVNRFLLDVGSLPVNERGLLIRKAKSASALCGDCFDALEAEEPAVQTRMGGSPCAAR